MPVAVVLWCIAALLAVAVLSVALGLPWLGAHFRLDALAAFFLVVVNLGGAAASLYGLGYGSHEPAPHRVLPFFAAQGGGLTARPPTAVVRLSGRRTVVKRGAEGIAIFVAPQ